MGFVGISQIFFSTTGLFQSLFPGYKSTKVRILIAAHDSPTGRVAALIPGTLEEQLRKNANGRRSSLLKNFPLFVIFALAFLVFFTLGFTTSFPTSLWLFLSGGVVGLCCTVPFGFAVLHAVTLPLSRCAWPDFGSETFDKLHRQYPTLRWEYCQDGRDTKIHVILIQPESPED